MVPTSTPRFGMAMNLAGNYKQVQSIYTRAVADFLETKKLGKDSFHQGNAFASFFSKLEETVDGLPLRVQFETLLLNRKSGVLGLKNQPIALVAYHAEDDTVSMATGIQMKALLKTAQILDMKPELLFFKVAEPYRVIRNFVVASYQKFLNQGMN
jgi:hypothetical protein